jgi:tetratricopeptide (TPR) repeat protein
MPEQQARLQERDRLAAQARKLGQAGKTAEMIAAWEKKITIERAVFGDVHEQVAQSLAELARMQVRRDDFRAAVQARREALAVRVKLHGEKDWRVTDARLDLDDGERMTKLPPRSLQRLREATALTDQVESLWQRGRWREALPLARRALEARVEILGEKHRASIWSKSNLALVYQAMGDSRKALTLLEQALALRKKLLGEEHPDYATSLYNLAWLYQAMGDSRKALPLYEQARDLAKKVLGEQHPHYAASLNNLAVLYREMGDSRKALPLLEQTLALRKKLLGEQHPLYAQSLNNLAWLYKDMGDYRKAQPLFEQARDLAKKVLGEQHPDYAQSLYNLAWLYQDMGDYRKALPLYEQARDLRKKVLGEQHRDYAQSLYNLAGLYQVMGDYRKALPLYEQARDLRKKVLGEHHPHYAHSLNGLALLYQDLGDYPKALPLHEQTLALRKKVLGEHHPDYAQSLHNLALLYQEMGDYRKALPLYEQARDLRKKVLGEHHPDYAHSLYNLAWLYGAMGDYHEALPLLKQALALRKKVLGEEHPHYARCLNNLALLYRAMGDYHKALPRFEQARDLYKKLLGEQHPDYAGSLINLAWLYQEMGDYRKALTLYEQARDLAKKVLGEQHPLYANSLHNLAMLHLANKQPVQAAALCREALTRQRAFLDQTFTALAGRQRLDFLNQQRRFLDLYLTLAAHSDIPAADCYRHVLAWKGAVATRHAEERLARDQPELQPQFEELRQLRAALARLVRATPANLQQQADWRTRFDDLERRKEQLEANLALDSGSYRRFLQLRQATARHVADALPEHTALVDFLEYNHVIPPPQRKGRFERERRFVAFVVVRGRKPVLVPLERAEPIEQAVQAWRKPMQSIPLGRIDERAGMELRRRVWQPLQAHLGDASTVLLAPDGALTALPFAALPGGKPGTFLIEDITLGHVASGRQLLELASDAQRPAGRGLLAVGDLPYGTAPDAATLAATPGALAVGLLPGTRRELDRIDAAHRHAWPKERVKLLTGAAIDAPCLKRELAVSGDKPGYRYLHLATHGFFEPPPENTRSRQRSFDALSVEYRTYDRNPMLLSGLVLAGANRAPQDGVLSAEEVSDLDLRGVELVVLSACQTGLGKVASGEGVLGLQRAFHEAGARSLAVSLWSVSDAATSVLMEELYTNLWQKKMPRLQALRQAQLTVLGDPERVEARRRELRTELAKRGIAADVLERRGLAPKAVKVEADAPGGGRRSHPAWWAAFILSGDVFR